MSRYITKKRIFSLICLFILNLICFGLLNPLESPTVVLFGAFILLAIDFFVVFFVVVRIFQKLFGRPKQSARRLAAVLTGLVIILLALQSVGQLSVRDTLAVLLVCGISYFYLSYYHIQRD